jgi:hypothetical protein
VLRTRSKTEVPSAPITRTATELEESLPVQVAAATGEMKAVSRKRRTEMATIEESIVIERAREDIRTFMRSTDNQMVWQSNLVELSKLDDGDPRVGTRYRGVAKVAGRRVEWAAEIVEWDDLAFYTLRTTEASIGFELRYEFDEVPDGTRVTLPQEIATFGGFFGKLADPLVTRIYARDVKANLETLKDVTESGR